MHAHQTKSSVGDSPLQREGFGGGEAGNTFTTPSPTLT